MKQHFSTKESGEITNMSIEHNRRFPFRQKFLNWTFETGTNDRDIWESLISKKLTCFRPSRRVEKARGRQAGSASSLLTRSSSARFFDHHDWPRAWNRLPKSEPFNLTFVTEISRGKSNRQPRKFPIRNFPKSWVYLAKLKIQENAYGYR